MKKMKFFLAIVLSGHFLYAQDISIIPKPVSLVRGSGVFTVNPRTKIMVSGTDKTNLAFISNYLMTNYGYELKQGDNLKEKGIRLINKSLDAPLDKGYELTVNENGITIYGSDEGLFYGVVSLLQLFPAEKNKTTFTVPYLTIKDFPRFAYRGLHLDVGRYYFPVDFIKRYIDYMALHKMNYFHWHLTEDQGWRIEIKKYPRLTEIGAWRNGTILKNYPDSARGNTYTKTGGFYTQEEIKAIVRYAAERYITIVPEIELPGHASAAIAAYPELSCFPEEPTISYFRKWFKWSGDSTGKQVQQGWGIYSDVMVPSENTFRFLENVFDEVLALFPSKYIHIGGDECPKTNWKKSVFCQQLIKEKGLKDEHELQSYFVQRIEKYLNSKGRMIIGWDEILEGGLAPNAIVMSWRGETGGIAAAKQGHQVIMTPGKPVYFDHSQCKKEDSAVIGGYNPIEKVYAYEPVPAELTGDETGYVLGAQGNVWTEYMNNPRKVEYMVFPRLSALSEVLWTPAQNKDWPDFKRRLALQFKRYDLWNVHYSSEVWKEDTAKP